jgi:hypothetical protein
VGNRFPPATCPRQLEEVLQEWYKIRLECSKLVRVHSNKE